MSDVTVVISNTGPQGVGVPAGGTTGQSLVKLSNTDYATGWSNAGSGTVTSVGLSLPGLFTVSNSPVTAAGTLTAVLATQQANRVLAGPTTGADAAPTFRALVGADIPLATDSVQGALSAADFTRLQQLGADDSPSFAGLTITGTAAVSIPHIHGDLAGAVYIHVKNTSAGTLAKGTPVYVTGAVGDTTTLEVAPADSSSASFLPAIGLLADALAPNASGHAVIAGELTGLNTAAYAIGDALYVANGGGLTATRPTTGTIQQVAIVGRVNGTTGSVTVTISTELSPTWDTAYSERLRWDGGATGLDAATGRTSLGLGTLATQSGTFSGTSSGTNSGDVSLAASVADVLDLTGQVLSADDPGADRLLFWDDSESKLRHLTLGTTLSISGTTIDVTNAVTDGDKGDITVASSGTSWTIDNGAVTYAKIQDVSATDRLLGRSSAGAGSVEEITCTAAGRALLDDADAAAQRTTLGLGTLATQSGTFSGTSSGTNSGDVSLAASVADVFDLTGQTLSADDPGADRLLFWDDSESKLRHLSLGTNLTITDTVLDAAGGGGSGTPGGSTTQVQFNDAGAFAGDADFTWDKTANTLNVKGSVRLDDAVGTFDTIVQSVPATATRYITFPDKSGVVVLGDAIRTKSVFTAIEAQPPAANFARRDTRNSVPVLEFRDSPTDEATVFLGVLAEGTDVSLGLLVRIWWMADIATTGNVRWAAEFERLVTDLDADSFDTATEVTTTTSGTSGIPVVSSLFCSTIDSLVAGDAYRLRITRRASNLTEDNMTGDAQIVAVEVRGVA